MGVEKPQQQALACCFICLSIFPLKHESKSLPGRGLRPNRRCDILARIDFLTPELRNSFNENA